ncbi:PapD-like protein [Podospora australis]|uniref:PapD-like protein n=1 Tax=Podospora australis TaxID=1536484 RepID=A0AAN6WU51_9PEZI|nr:PapD-like protein [Podospora australis]
MSVEIDPQELGFRRPFTVEVAQILKIKNPNSSPVAFKVKTTAPKQYCVRPNSGRIEPGHEVEVSVLLQAMKQEPAPDARCRDKFLVQSVTITPDKEFSNVQQIWDGVPKSDIQERKIRVSWLAPNEDGHVDSVATPIRRSLANGHEDTPSNAPPPAYSSPNEESTVLDNSPAPEPAAPASPKIKREDEDKPPVFNAPTTVANTVKSAVNDTVEEFKAKLAKAEETIAQLRDEAASGLRQRNVAKKDDSNPATSHPAAQTTQAARQGTEGVPVKIVAVLCLVSFLLAYFFF